MLVIEDSRMLQALLLTAYMKLVVAHPQDVALKESVDAVFQRHSR